MPRFFVAASNIFGGAAYLSVKEIAHLQALRVRRHIVPVGVMRVKASGAAPL